MALRLLIVCLVGAGAAGLLALGVSRRIDFLVRGLCTSTRRIGAGDYTVEVAGRRRADQLGDLAREIEALRDRAKEADALRGERDRLEQLTAQEAKAQAGATAARFESDLTSSST